MRESQTNFERDWSPSMFGLPFFQLVSGGTRDIDWGFHSFVRLYFCDWYTIYVPLTTLPIQTKTPEHYHSDCRPNRPQNSPFTIQKGASSSGHSILILYRKLVWKTKLDARKNCFGPYPHLINAISRYLESLVNELGHPLKLECDQIEAHRAARSVHPARIFYAHQRCVYKRHGDPIR